MNGIMEALPFLIPLLILQLSLMGFSVYHVLTHKKYRCGNRILWLILCLCLNVIGPVLYFLLGKEDA